MYSYYAVHNSECDSNCVCESNLESESEPFNIYWGLLKFVSTSFNQSEEHHLCVSLACGLLFFQTVEKEKNT